MCEIVTVTKTEIYKPTIPQKNIVLIKMLATRAVIIHLVMG